MQAYRDLALDIVLSPALWLSLLFGLIYGLLFTFWRGGGWRQGVRDLVAATAGFAIGQLFSLVLPLSAARVGQVNLLWGSVFAVLFLLLGRRVWKGRPPAAAKPASPKSL